MFNKYLLLIIVVFFTSLNLFADKLNDIQEKELMHVGVRYEHKPLGFINRYGKISGFEVDLVKFIANKLNVMVKFHQITSQNKINDLLTDKIDFMVSALDFKNTKGIDTTQEYFFDEIVLLTHKTNGIINTKDLSHKVIARVKGELNSSYLSKEFKTARIIDFIEYPQAIRSLRKSNISAIMANRAWSEEVLKKSIDKFKIIPLQKHSLSYVISVKKGELRLKNILNKAIQDSVREGIYQETYNKWFLVNAKKLPKLTI